MAEVLQEVPGFPDEAPLVRTFTISVPKVAASTASTVVPGFIVPFNGTVFAASYASIGAVAESAANYNVYEVFVSKADGTGSVLAASYSTKEEAAKAEKLVAKVAKALKLSATEANLVIEAGGFVEFKLSMTGTGQEDKAGILRVSVMRNVKATPKEQPGV